MSAAVGLERKGVTLFTAPKPFEGHIGRIQRNALRSWKTLGEDTEIILIGDEPGAAQVASKLGLRHIQAVERNESGTPLISSIFKLAEGAAARRVMCYANADVLFLDDFLPSVAAATERFERFLLVGQRWDLRVERDLAFSAEDVFELRRKLAREGRLHPPAGSDYFVYPRGMFREIPGFALGRAGWDNWMIYAARHLGAAVVDATQGITVVHQDHDYSHLPGGQPHYRLPESQTNVDLAGGREAIFTLRDATWIMDGTEIRRAPWGTSGLRRRLESGVIAAVGTGLMARATRLALHPVETIRYFAGKAQRPPAWNQVSDPGGPGDAPSSTS